MDKQRAVIYIRVSDPSQVENNSLETQLKSCQNFADNNKYTVVKTFREEGFSAKHIHNRPEMKRLLEFCTLKKNNISAVIVYKMDRWTRNVEEGLVSISLLAKYGTVVIPATEIAEQTPIGKAIRTILMAVGEMDNQNKGQRVKDNMQSMFRNGYWCWKPRIGYKRPFRTKEESKGKPVIIDKRFGDVLKSIFYKASEVTVSKDYLANYANSLGFKDIYGKEADGRLIGRLLSDTFYYGYMYAPKWNEYAWGKHKPIISQEIWEKANINVFGRKGKYKHQDNAVFPLKGLVKCSSCNKALTSSNPRGTSKNYLYYECHNSKCDNHQRIGVESAHEQFMTLLTSIRPSERVLKMFTHMVFSEWDKSIELRKQDATILEEQIKTLEHKLTTIAESNAKFILTDDEAQERASEIRKDIAVLRIERSDIRIEQYDTEAVKNYTENFLVNIDKLWLQIELPHKQALQNEIFKGGLLVEKGKIRIVELASTFKLIEELSMPNVDFVTPREVESRLVE